MSDYYTVEYHEFLAPASIGGITVDGVRYSGTPMRDTADGTPSGDLVAVPNLGCSAVSNLAYGHLAQLIGFRPITWASM